MCLGPPQDPSNIQYGFLWAHIGWRCHNVPQRKEVKVSDLYKDTLLGWQNTLYLPLAFIMGIVLPVYVCDYFWNDLWVSLFENGIVIDSMISAGWYLLCCIRKNRNWPTLALLDTEFVSFGGHPALF